MPIGHVFRRDDRLDGRSPKAEHALNHIRRVVAKELVAEELTHQLAAVYQCLAYGPSAHPRRSGNLPRRPFTVRWLDLLDERDEGWMQNREVREYVAALLPDILVEVQPVESGVQLAINWVRDRRVERQRYEVRERRD